MLGTYMRLLKFWAVFVETQKWILDTLSFRYSSCLQPDPDSWGVRAGGMRPHPQPGSCYRHINARHSTSLPNNQWGATASKPQAGPTPTWSGWWSLTVFVRKDFLCPWRDLLSRSYKNFFSSLWKYEPLKISQLVTQEETHLKSWIVFQNLDLNLWNAAFCITQVILPGVWGCVCASLWCTQALCGTVWQTQGGSARVNWVTSSLMQNWELSAAGRTFISSDEWQRGIFISLINFAGLTVRKITSWLLHQEVWVREALGGLDELTLLLKSQNLEPSQLLHAWGWEVLVGLGKQHLCCQARKRNSDGSEVTAFVKETLRQEQSILLTGRMSLLSVDVWKIKAG